MNGELDLWQYLEQREELIVRKREELKIELEALRETRASLERSQRVKGLENQKGKPTIKEMIRDALSRHVEGGTSDQIIHWINQLHETEVARTSLSPQLSRLKADGEVRLDESTGKWGLTGVSVKLDRRDYVNAHRSDIDEAMRRRFQSTEHIKRSK